MEVEQISSSKNPNTPLNSSILQNPPKIITGTGAGGSPHTIPEQLTMNQAVGQDKGINMTLMKTFI